MCRTVQSRRLLQNRATLSLGLLLTLGLLGGLLVISIQLGAAQISSATVFDALLAYDDTNFDHIVIHIVRLPRVLAGIIVGAALAVAGAIMQGLTRNPLADPGILGISAGATFAVVLALFINRDLSLSSYTQIAFIGAGIAAMLVYAIGSAGRGGATPLKLTLAGAVLTSFVGSLTAAILLQDQETLDQVRFWTAGSLAGREMPLVQQTAPYMLIGLVSAMLLSKQLTLLSLGDDVAQGLGQSTTWIKLLAVIIVVLLAGSAVALAGPIGFVGLIVPHLVRFVVGADYRWIIPYSAVVGGILVTVSDMAARVVLRPQEFPVGVMLAVLGAPFFIYLARWRVQ